MNIIDKKILLHIKNSNVNMNNSNIDISKNFIDAKMQVYSPNIILVLNFNQAFIGEQLILRDEQLEEYNTYTINNTSMTITLQNDFQLGDIIYLQLGCMHIEYSKKILIQHNGYIRVNFDIEKDLDIYTWPFIQSIQVQGLASSIWLVGDSKEMILNSMDSSLSSNVFYQDYNEYKIRAFILSFNHYSSVEGTKLMHWCIGKNYLNSNIQQSVKNIELADIYGVDLNNDIRIIYCRDFLAVLPNELSTIIKNVQKEYTNGYSQPSIQTDKIFCLSENEIWGGKIYSDNFLGSQYDYFEGLSSKIFYDKQIIDKSVGYVLRDRGYRNDYIGFCGVDTDGTPTVFDYGDYSHNTAAFVPCFCI